MTEIITDYLDAKQLADRLTALELHSTSELARLEKERDDAREEAAHWKSEWEIVEARLCGWKHPSDNGIIFEHEVIPVLRKERDDAREDLDEETKFHHRTHIELIQTQCKLLDMEMQRDEAREKLSAAWQSLRNSQDEVLRLTFENRELSQSIQGWENKWKCAIDMAARAELERDEALKCAKEYYVEFIRNASSDNKVSKPNPLNPFYKY